MAVVLAVEFNNLIPLRLPHLLLSLQPLLNNLKLLIRGQRPIRQRLIVIDQLKRLVLLFVFYLLPLLEFQLGLVSYEPMH